MEVSYNLRYQKANFSNRVMVDKEGEVIIYGKGFRLKGKGATDKGELINFSEIKEFYYRDEKIFFVTFNKEKYTLADTGTQFDQVVVDIYKARNEFLMDALFMKMGKLKAEFEGHFERMSKFTKLISKSNAKLRLYEGSLLVIPPKQDAFSIQFNFVNYYEFDEMDYQLKIVMDDGSTILISQLGNDYELFQEKMDGLLGGMYEKVVNGVLKEAFVQFHAATLLKLAYNMKEGKGVALKEIKKMDKELAGEVESFIFQDENFKKKMQIFKDMCDDGQTFYGIAKDEAVKDSFIRWVMYAVPSKNIVAFCILPRWQQGGVQAKTGAGQGSSVEKYETFFYKIIIEQGKPEDKLQDKIQEINQALVNLHFVKDPCFKDKRDLRHSPYQYAIRKLPYLRILRKSFAGVAHAVEVEAWHKQVEEIFKNATLG
ncbi:MAG: hypothetical protein AAB373_00270 [Patescibacteria group bacterium]